MQIQDVIQALGLLPPSVADGYAEALRHALRAIGQVALTQAPQGVEVPGMEDLEVEAGLGAEVDLGALVLAQAELEWLRGVAEPGTPGMPGGARIIDDYIRGPEGLSWRTCDVKTWKPNVSYTYNGQFSWCGAFAARCWAAAGLRLAVRQKHLAGTGRLYRWAHGTGRWLRPDQLRPGCIAVMGPEGSGDGEHIDLVERVHPDGIDAFDGNSRGRGPDGRIYEGVVKTHRPFAHAATSKAQYRILYGIWPLPEDLVGG